MEVFVENLGKYNEGFIQGGWLELPATKERINNFLKNEVGINKQYEEYRLTDIETKLSCYDLRGLEFENLDNLNLLAAYENIASNIDLINDYCANSSISDPIEICNAIAQEDNISTMPIPLYVQGPPSSDNEKLAYALAEGINLQETFNQKGLGEFYKYFDFESYGRDESINGNFVVKDDFIIDIGGSSVDPYLFNRGELVKILDQIAILKKLSERQTKQSIKDKLADAQTQEGENNMKRFFIETNGGNMIAFVDDKNKAFVLYDQSFDKELALETARNADYSNLDGCKTAEDCDGAMGMGGDRIIDFEELLSYAESYTEFTEDGSVHETYTKDAFSGWTLKETTDQPDISADNCKHKGR